MAYDPTQTKVSIYDIVPLLNDRMTLPQIAKHFCISLETVKRYIKKLRINGYVFNLPKGRPKKKPLVI